MAASLQPAAAADQKQVVASPFHLPNWCRAAKKGDAAEAKKVVELAYESWVGKEVAERRKVGAAIRQQLESEKETIAAVIKLGLTKNGGCAVDLLQPLTNLYNGVVLGDDDKAASNWADSVQKLILS